MGFQKGNTFSKGRPCKYKGVPRSEETKLALKKAWFLRRIKFGIPVKKPKPPRGYTEIFLTVEAFIQRHDLRPTFEENLYVSPKGEVYTVLPFFDHCCYLLRKQQLLNSGYKVVKFNHRQATVHRLVALAFIPNSENKSDVNHKNGIKTDNRVENLEWTTRKENMYHFFHDEGSKYNEDWAKKLKHHHVATVRNAKKIGTRLRTKKVEVK